MYWHGLEAPFVMQDHKESDYQQQIPKISYISSLKWSALP